MGWGLDKIFGVGEEGISQGDPKLKHWATSPFSSYEGERPKAEALGYLEAIAKERSLSPLGG